MDLSLEEWRKRVPGVIATRYDGREPIDRIDKAMKGDGSWLWFDGYASLVSIRALLDACPDIKSVTLDLTGLVQGGWVDFDEAVCAKRREADMSVLRTLAPTVILVGRRKLRHSNSETLARGSLSGASGILFVLQPRRTKR